MKQKSVMMLMAATAITLGGCSKKAPNELPPAPMANVDDAYNTQPDKPAPGSQGDFIANVASDRIFFDTDKFNVDPEDQVILRSQAEWLARYPQKRIVVEGHCDERGTRDYNIALGDRRANAAKNYLAAMGVSPSRITVVSYGKERPVALGSDENAWAQNRRAVTITIE